MSYGEVWRADRGKRHCFTDNCSTFQAPRKLFSPQTITPTLILTLLIYPYPNPNPKTKTFHKIEELFRLSRTSFSTSYRVPIYSTRLGRRSCSRGWPSCHAATLAWAVAIFSRKESFCSPFFFLSSFFASSFWRRVPRLAPSCWTILVKQILNKWMNLKKKLLYFFAPNRLETRRRP